ncbi:hypothetical protein BDD12DRAFT_857489, partial [Trichophaea hybrida]
PQLQLDIGGRVVTVHLRHFFFRSFDDIPAETAASLICHQAEQLFIRYNAVIRQLTVSNMSSPHNAARGFIDFSLSAMITAGFLFGDHLFRNNMVAGFLDIQSETIVAGFRGPYTTSTYSALLYDKDMWLVGGDGRVCTNPVDSDSESDTGFFDKLFSPTEEAPAVPDGQLFTGFMELWRFVKERGSKDNLHAAAVCSVFPTYPSRDSEYLELMLRDIYGLRCAKDLPEGRHGNETFQLPSVWLSDCIHHYLKEFVRFRKERSRVNRRKEMGDDGEWVPSAGT